MELRLPFDALNVMVKDPTAAEDVAVNMTDCPPVVIEKGEGGEA